MSRYFSKQCPYCKAEFSLDHLVNEPQSRLIGMSFVEDSIEWVFYFFQHDHPNCGTSFVVRVDEFAPYIDEPIPTGKLALRECCEQHCVNLEDLSNCRQPCHFAPFRRFMHKMIAAKKGELPRLTPAKNAPLERTFSV